MEPTDAHYCFASQGPDETLEAARRLAGAIAGEGLVIRLDGPLGAGKTVFVKGLASGFGIDPGGVSSPTFTLVNEYPTHPTSSRQAGLKRLAHADLYRVESERALEEVGFFDLMESSTVLAVEWGDRFPGAFPRDHLELTIERPLAGGGGDPADTGARQIRVRGRGERARRVVEAWRQAMRGS